jgi:hypothetical protein
MTTSTTSTTTPTPPCTRCGNPGADLYQLTSKPYGPSLCLPDWQTANAGYWDGVEIANGRVTFPSGHPYADPAA